MRAFAFLLILGSLGFAQANKTQVVMLGAGTPNPDPENSGPAVAVVVNGESYLVDAGPGIVRRAAAAEKKGVKALAPEQLKRVFITHLHSDHTLGLPDLMLSPWVLEREVALQIYGPPGTKKLVTHILKAYEDDIYHRTHSLEPVPKTRPWRPEVHEIKPGEIFHDANVTVTAFPVPHTQWKHSFAYTFQTADRRIVISGDTTPTDEIVRQCNGCDVLVHEVYSAEKLPTRPPEWQRYHRQSHTSTKELAELENRAHPKLLVLYHKLFWGTDDAGLVREVHEAGYKGQVVSGKDLESY